MNQIFSFHRFGLLLNLHFSEHLRTYLLGLGVLAGVLALLMIGTLRLDAYYEEIYSSHSQTFVVVFAAAACWFASEAFKGYQSPVQGIPGLMLPAARLEKFLVLLLMCLLFIPVYTAIFYGIEGLYFSIVNAKLPATSEKYGLMDPTHPNVKRSWGPFFLALLAYGFFLLGSVYFKKAAFVKTGVLAFLLFLGGIYLNSALLNSLLPDVHKIYGTFPFKGFGVQTPAGQGFEVEATEMVQKLANGFWNLMIPALLFTAYVRFKEKEI